MVHLILSLLFHHSPQPPVPVQRTAYVQAWDANNHAHWLAINAEILRAKKKVGEK